LSKEDALEVEESLKHAEFKSDLINFKTSNFTFTNATYTISNAKISALYWVNGVTSLESKLTKEEEEVFLRVKPL
jgi:hypothetical protein